MWHTSIVIGGTELYYGHGINRAMPPGTTPFGGAPVERIRLGETEVDDEALEDILESMSDRYSPEAYRLLTHNCNHFSDELAHALVGRGIPSHIRSLPDDVMSTAFGQMLRPTLDNFERRMASARSAEGPLRFGHGGTRVPAGATEAPATPQAAPVSTASAATLAPVPSSSVASPAPVPSSAVAPLAPVPSSSAAALLPAAPSVPPSVSQAASPSVVSASEGASTRSSEASLTQVAPPPAGRRGPVTASEPLTAHELEAALDAALASAMETETSEHGPELARLALERRVLDRVDRMQREGGLSPEEAALRALHEEAQEDGAK